jgi:hypothetical protein
MNGATDEIAAVSRPAQPAALLSGAFNFRDLGGLPTTDGSRTVFGSVFRSDALDDLTPRDFEILGGVLGIKTVVDLRAAVETEGRQPPWKRGLDAELVRLPLSDEWTSWGELDAESRRTLLARKYHFRAERHYRQRRTAPDYCALHGRQGSHRGTRLDTAQSARRGARCHSRGLFADCREYESDYGAAEGKPYLPRSGARQPRRGLSGTGAHYEDFSSDPGRA